MKDGALKLPSYIASFGVYQDFYTGNYLTNETSTAISFIGSINTFLGTSVSLVSGTLYDRGYFYHLVVAGSLLQSFSLFMLSLAKPNQYYQIFLTQGLGSGIAVGLLYIPSLAIVSHYFRRKRTLVMAFVTMGSSLGAIIHPIMLNNLLNGRLGFANGVRASAGLVSALLLIACLCMRTRLDPPTTPVNYIVAARKCLRDVPFFFTTVGAFLFQIGLYYPTFFLQLDSTQHGISITFSSYSLVILNASSSVGRVSAGYIAGYIGVLNLTVISAISCGLILLGTIGLSSLASVVIIAVLFGYFQGVYTALLSPLMATLTHNPSELGHSGWMGISFFLGGFGSLIGTPISGALLSTYIKLYLVETRSVLWGESTAIAASLYTLINQSQIAALAGAAMYIFMRFVYIRVQKKNES
ncbi:major facilitator superfamily domain-containing protein [Suillus variegatus]|nr:major facilitator superfamily domain-containing protein [Suillus variegatus]